MQLKATDKIPEWVYQSGFYSVTRSIDELSIICEEELVQNVSVASKGWRILKINSVLDLSLTGITAKFSKALADAGVNLSVVATYNTDYILVEDAKLEIAKEALQNAGFEVA